MDTPFDPHRYLFVVRLWLEASLNADGRVPAVPTGENCSQWRGSVENVVTSQRLYFTSLAELNDFILLQLGEQGDLKALIQPEDMPGPAIQN
ncbi:MAG: hypothetical protein AB1894_23775 [Chloroflexota bacterium]